MILETGELGTYDNVRRASLLAMAAGADFIKTSTGKIPSAATLPVALCMLEAIRDVYEETGRAVGFKPAGGVRQAKQAVQHLILVHHEQRRTIPADQTILLRFECRHQNRRIQILGQIAGSNANIPAAAAPFGQLIIGQGPGRHRVDRLPTVFAEIRPQLENQRLARTSRGLNHNVFAVPKRRHSLLLPEVRHCHLIEPWKIGKW